ncbi:hypothetical protein L914_17333 [Phytophthora nicotianae]|uniref:Uncharacterized protein n=1 Tax=Phytophthora nicotianae TaxID=4792 RepID=W2MJK1_PHYNI|nr:hypothetical protein L914_17333 [Phytophthora nicotianae]
MISAGYAVNLDDQVKIAKNNVVMEKTVIMYSQDYVSWFYQRKRSGDIFLSGVQKYALQYDTARVVALPGNYLLRIHIDNPSMSPITTRRIELETSSCFYVDDQ